MKFIRQVLAVFLSVFLASPVWAADKKAEVDSDYHFFKLGVRPIDPSGDVDWDKECVVTLTDHSPKVKLQYKKADGSIGTSNFGNVRKGVEVIVDGKTGYALRLRICGNGVVEPNNWEPIGEEYCKEEAPIMKPGDVVPVVAPPSPPSVSEAPKFGLGLDPGNLGAKKLNFEEQKLTTEPQSKKAEVGVGKDNDKSATWPYWVGGGAAAVIAFILIFSNKGKGDPKTSGGPAVDPPNSVLSYSW